MKEKIPDKRAMERMTSDLTRMLQGKNFNSKEDLDDYLKGVVGKGRVPKMPPKSAVQLAQDIMYEAWEADNDKERIKLAREALSVSPDCADAYVLLAEEEAGHFWGLLETRPYMRAREGVVWCLWNLGESEKAIEHCYEMLKLNPNDNQGMRHTLICYLADLQRYDELDRFLNHGDYNDDGGTERLYTRALVNFVKKGDVPETRDALKEALKGNAHVPDYLVGKKKIPGEIPDFVTWGGEDEAIGFVDNFLAAWQKVPDAIEWLKAPVGIKTVPKIGRNEACPCGSGKKYKKCCGR